MGKTAVFTVTATVRGICTIVSIVPLLWSLHSSEDRSIIHWIERKCHHFFGGSEHVLWSRSGFQATEILFLHHVIPCLRKMLLCRHVRVCADQSGQSAVIVSSRWVFHHPSWQPGTTHRQALMRMSINGQNSKVFATRFLRNAMNRRFTS